MRTEPDVGGSNAPRRYNKVLFPDPDGPMMATDSPRPTCRETSSRIGTGPRGVSYRFETRSAISTMEFGIENSRHEFRILNSEFLIQGPSPQSPVPDVVLAAFHPEDDPMEKHDHPTGRPIVAKNPAAMAAGVYTVFSYKLEGNTIQVTTVRDQNGPIPVPVTIKAVRVE